MNDSSHPNPSLNRLTLKVRAENEQIYKLLRQTAKQTAKASGLKSLDALIVGGFVRDQMISLPCNDVDVVVEVGSFEAFMSALVSQAEAMDAQVKTTSAHLLKNSVCGGLKLVKLLVTVSGRSYEVDLRELREPIELDAKKRDFTFNAIYLNLKTGCLHDPLGGIEDLRRSVIRGCDEPAAVFRQKVRIFRALRFEETLDCALDPALLEAIKKTAIGREDASSVVAELEKIMSCRPHRWRILKRIAEVNKHGVFFKLFKDYALTDFKPQAFKRELLLTVSQLESAEQELFSLADHNYSRLDEVTVIKQYILVATMRCCDPITPLDLTQASLALWFKREEMNERFYLKLNQTILLAGRLVSCGSVSLQRIREKLLSLRLPLKFYPCLISASGSASRFSQLVPQQAEQFQRIFERFASSAANF